MNNRPVFLVLFVCMGNICRSPAAEGVLQKAVRRSALEKKIFVDSAGTIGYHAGHPPDSRMVATAARRGIHLQGQARQVTRSDLEEFDLIIAMDSDNLSGLRSLHPAPSSRLELFSHWVDQERWPIDVPDPYYGGTEGFEYVMDMIEEGAAGILSEIRSLL